MEHFISVKTLFVLKRYDIANASIMPPLHNGGCELFGRNENNSNTLGNFEP